MVAALLPKRINVTEPYVPWVTCKLLPVLSLDFSPLRLVDGYSQHLVFLTVFFVPSQQPSVLFISEQAFQPWYYWSIPHNLGRNPFLGRSPSTSPGSSRLILYRNAVHTRHASLIAVEDAVINACMYLLHI